MGSRKQLPSTQRVDLSDAQDSAPREVPALVVLRGPEADFGVHVLVDRPVTVGRDPSCRLRLHGEGISRKHLRVFPEGEEFFAEDLGSTNGTLVNEERLAGRRRLEQGDRLFLGTTVLKFTGADPLEIGYHARMDRLSGSDNLTGLVAWRRFDAAFTRAVEDAAATGSPIALLAIDLDRLKEINDRHGHATGAHTIRTVGRMLGELVGRQGAACRFGGDEFFAFVRGADLAGACRLAEALRARLAATDVEKDGVHLRPTLSIGVVSLSEEARTPKALFEAADAALYRAKRAGRDRVAT